MEKTGNGSAIGPMPESDAAITGATGGSAGGASTADLRRGYVDSDHEYAKDGDHPMTVAPEPAGQGFLGRPHGWER